jgi:uncharacterized phage-like protein YoqJ
MMIHRVGVTGHRKLLGKQLEVYSRTLEFLRTIQEQYRALGMSVEVNTGMALGFDQLVCDVCLELGIPYVAVIPCDNQEALWPVAQQDRYSKLVSMATRTVLVNPGPYEAWKMHARNGWIVNNSDEMVVHWDGFYQGGTGNCMKLVKSKKLFWKNTA